MPFPPQFVGLWIVQESKYRICTKWTQTINAGHLILETKILSCEKHIKVNHPMSIIYIYIYGRKTSEEKESGRGETWLKKLSQTVYISVTFPFYQEASHESKGVIYHSMQLKGYVGWSDLSRIVFCWLVYFSASLFHIKQQISFSRSSSRKYTMGDTAVQWKWHIL